MRHSIYTSAGTLSFQCKHWNGPGYELISTDSHDIICVPFFQSIWCNHLTTHYELFVGVAILVHYKSQLMQCHTVESLMEVTKCTQTMHAEISKLHVQHIMFGCALLDC